MVFRFAATLCVWLVLVASIGCDSGNAQQASSPRTAHPDVASPWHSELEETLTVTVNGQPLVFRLILPGTFVMGDNNYYSARGSLGRRLNTGGAFNQGPERVTTITKPFYMLETEITTAIYCEFLNQTTTPAICVSDVDPMLVSRIELVNGKYQPRLGCNNHAVNCATWSGATDFCAWLSELSASDIRLPTEAQWAFAARGPQSSTFPWGNTWKYGTTYSDTHEQACSATAGSAVMSHPLNRTPIGLYDMLGSVPEWTLDKYVDSYDPSDAIDPLVTGGGIPVLRGRTTTTFREGVAASMNHEVISGFRPILVVEAPGETTK